ncbi:MAG: TasA family protein [Candidatus Moraniibacteriota bacterium]
MQKIWKSGLVALAVAVAVGGATYSFFSDTETSTGNTFTAGDIDLQIDNESYVTNRAGVLVASPSTSWSLKDLVPGVDHFFNFTDLKPGDVGEDTISIHVGSNDAWMCAAARITSDLDNSITEPEDESDADDDNADATVDGDLDTAMNFMFWHDDGDNVLEVGETPFLNGTLASMGAAGQIRLADTTGSILGATAPIPGGTTFYIGKAWCYGALAAGTVAQDNLGKTGSNGPLVRGTGVTCNGAAIGNEGQTDSVVGDLQFYATQSRNNSTFTCANYQPTWPAEVVRRLVGAANFVAGSPTCDITVNDDGGDDTRDTIQEGVDLAVAGQTVCVAPGAYNQFTVSKALTVRGLSDPEGGTPAVVTPTSSSVTDLALVTASNVTITGLKFDGNGTVTAGQAAGVRVSDAGSSLSGVNITYNVVTNISAATGFASKGIQWFTDTNSGFALSNSTFANNTISNIAAVDKGGYGIQTVGTMSNVAIQNNTISNTTGAWGAGIAVDTKNTTLTSVTGSTISRNQVLTGVSNGTTRFSVQVENGINATGVGVHQNNLETSLHGGGNVALGTEGILNAQSNWWGTAAPVIATDVFNSGANVTDFTLPEASAFVLN